MDTGHTDYEIIHLLNLEKEDGESKEEAVENVAHQYSFSRSEVEQWAVEVYDSD